MKLEIEIDENDIQQMVQQFLSSRNLKLDDTKKLEAKLKKVFQKMKLKVEPVFVGYPYSSPWYNPYFRFGEVYCGNGEIGAGITVTNLPSTSTHIDFPGLITTTSGGAGNNLGTFYGTGLGTGVSGSVGSGQLAGTVLGTGSEGFSLRDTPSNVYKIKTNDSK